jgi:hypothetical protein
VGLLNLKLEREVKKTEVTVRSPSRRKRFAFDHSAISEEEEKEWEEEEMMVVVVVVVMMMMMMMMRCC